jgi:hypothetical protein
MSALRAVYCWQNIGVSLPGVDPNTIKLMDFFAGSPYRNGIGINPCGISLRPTSTKSDTDLRYML